MKNNRLNVLKLTIVIAAVCSNIYPNSKLAQTGFQFMSVGADARAGAMAQALTAAETNSSAMFFNPSGMARMNEPFEVTFSQNNWIAGIKHNTFTLALRPFGGRYGVLGFSAMSVDYGEVQGTQVWGNSKGYIDTEIIYPSALLFGVGYAKTLSDKFAVGGQVKYAGQQLGRSLVSINDSLMVKDNVVFGTAFDFGTIYYTGFKSLAFGMSVRNFSNEIKYVRESFQLPLTFRIGISMDLFDIIDEEIKEHTLFIDLDAIHPRSYPEQLNVGLEYSWNTQLFIRLGYMFVSDEQHYSLGFGLRISVLTIDYAYTPYGVFDNVQRITLRFTL